MNEVKNMIDTVTQLMNKHGIMIRDTWAGLDGPNLDDFYSNGNKYYGPKLFKIELSDNDNGYTNAKAKKKYEIPGLKHVAYDAYQICVPTRFVNKKHPVIHELVHFLQENSIQEDNNYITYNGTNYAKYVTQKSELEAHLIQCLYIREFEADLIAPESLNEIDLLINNLGNEESKLSLIFLFNRLGII